MRLLLAFVGAAVVTAVAAASGPSDDLRLAQALVVHRGDVPAYWDATIVRNPCAVATPGLAARATARWGSPTHGLWSVAVVSGTAKNARAEYSRFAGYVPSCLARKFKAVVTPLRVPPLGDECRGWRVSRGATRLDVIVVRSGRAVVSDILGTQGVTSGFAIVRKQLARGR